MRSLRCEDRKHSIHGTELKEVSTRTRTETAPPDFSAGANRQASRISRELASNCVSPLDARSFRTPTGPSFSMTAAIRVRPRSAPRSLLRRGKGWIRGRGCFISGDNRPGSRPSLFTNQGSGLSTLSSSTQPEVPSGATTLVHNPCLASPITKSTLEGPKAAITLDFSSGRSRSLRRLVTQNSHFSS